MTGKQAKIVKAAARRAYKYDSELFWAWQALRQPFIPGNGSYAEQMAALGEQP